MVSTRVSTEKTDSSPKQNEKHDLKNSAVSALKKQSGASEKAAAPESNGSSDSEGKKDAIAANEKNGSRSGGEIVKEIMKDEGVVDEKKNNGTTTTIDLEEEDDFDLEVFPDSDKENEVKMEVDGEENKKKEEKVDDTTTTPTDDDNESSMSNGVAAMPSIEPGMPAILKRHVVLGSYTPVTMPKTGEFKMEDDEALIEVPSLTTPLLIKKKDRFARRISKKDGSFLPALGGPKRNAHNALKVGNSIVDFFNCFAGEFLINVGLNRAKEQYNKDMIRVKEREMRKRGKSLELLEDAKAHAEAYQEAKALNAPFTFTVKQCPRCDFKTESQLVLDGHLLTPHFTARRELQCSFCDFVTRDAKSIIFHMEALHQKIPTMEPPPQFYECPFCPFETNLKNKASTHINRCQKYFNNSVNQSPGNDYQAPGMTTKPITPDDIKMYEKFFMALSATSKSIPQRNSLPNASTISNMLRNGTPRAGMALYHQLPQALNMQQQAARGRGRGGSGNMALLQPSTPGAGGGMFQLVGHDVLPLLNGNPGLTVTLANQQQQQRNALQQQGRATSGMSSRVPGAATRLAQPGSGRAPVILESGSSSGGGTAAGVPPGGPTAGQFVICEICDGYIKDLEQLRTHMQWIHKVKIHPKMLASRPPLNCQKCQWRFFTDQGLERHLLGAHGLVTSNMQDLANMGQDGGRCTVCGRIYASKLVAHMSQVHRVVLKPAHLSYKCTVCTATFNLYKLFESHVYSVHSGAMKRGSTGSGGGSDAKKSATNNNNGVAATKGTTAAATTTTTAAAASSGDFYGAGTCKACNTPVDNLGEHIETKHMNRKSHVGVCHIEKCDDCLGAFDGMIVLHTADFGDADDDDSDDDDSDDSSSSSDDDDKKRDGDA